MGPRPSRCACGSWSCWPPRGSRCATAGWCCRPSAGPDRDGRPIGPVRPGTVGGPCFHREVAQRGGESGPVYRLVSSEPTAVRLPTLDEFQQAVVDHPGGPLLVLAGPGTGKTTTLVETIAARIERDGVSPDSVLALTFSRKAAEHLRDRVTARVGRTMSSTMSSTFHSFAYGLIRAYAPADLYDAPMRLLSAPEQDVVLRELLTDNPESVSWPESLGR